MVGWVDDYVLLLFNVRLIRFGVRHDLLPLLGDDVCLADVVHIARVARLLLVLLWVGLLLQLLGRVSHV